MKSKVMRFILVAMFFIDLFMLVVGNSLTDTVKFGFLTLILLILILEYYHA